MSVQNHASLTLEQTRVAAKGADNLADANQHGYLGLKGSVKLHLGDKEAILLGGGGDFIFVRCR